MTFLGYSLIVLILFSIVLTHKILLKLINGKFDKNKGVFFEKVIVFLLAFFVIFSLNSLTFYLSYFFYWEKTYRAFTENKYEAVVIGYKKEIISTNSSFNKNYLTNKKPFYFPKVKYINSEGKEIIKVLDITSDEPLKLGGKIKITDSYTNTRANTLNLDWFMFFGGSVFTGISAFFTFFISSYITNFNVKIRAKKSFYFGVIFLLINIICTSIINLVI